jgi:GTPase SAR1 family protein
MICAYAEQTVPITPRMIESVSAELNLGDHPFVLAPERSDKLRAGSLNEDISQFMAPLAGPIDESIDESEDSTQ